VASARQRDADGLERPRFFEVVAEAERERVEQILAEVLSRGRASPFDRQEEAEASRDRKCELFAAFRGYRNGDATDLRRLCGEDLLVVAPGRRLVPQPVGAIEVDVHCPEAFAIALRLEDDAPVLRDETAAIEDEAVVAADQVRV